MSDPVWTRLDRKVTILNVNFMRLSPWSRGYCRLVAALCTILSKHSENRFNLMAVKLN